MKVYAPMMFGQKLHRKSDEGGFRTRCGKPLGAYSVAHDDLDSVEDVVEFANRDDVRAGVCRVCFPDAEDDGRGEGASDSNAMGREWLPGDPQLTTEEVVQDRLRQFLQERVDHHRKMARVMNEPFRSDHQKLARAYEARLEEVGGE